MKTAKYFSHKEAESLIGKRIRTNMEFAGVPKGTGGFVVRADRSASDDKYDVGIQWELPNELKPLVDWFSRDEYYRFLEEIG